MGAETSNEYSKAAFKRPSLLGLFSAFAPLACSLQVDPVKAVPFGHVRENHLVAFFESI
jgi:hypothetical protein